MERLFLMFLDHKQRRSTVGRTSLDEWSARRRDLYLTTHYTHNRQISMPSVGFEPKISAIKQFKWPRPQCVNTDLQFMFHLVWSMLVLSQLHDEAARYFAIGPEISSRYWHRKVSCILHDSKNRIHFYSISARNTADDWFKLSCWQAYLTLKTLN